MSREFEPFEVMKRSGRSPHEIYLAAKALGMDDMCVLKMLRAVCGLSLAEAKSVTGALDMWTQKQSLTPGSTVYWEGSASNEGFYLMQGRVKNVCDDLVSLEDHKKFRLVSGGLEEVPADGGVATIPVKYFEKSLLERLKDTVDSWNHLASVKSEAV